MANGVPGLELRLPLLFTYGVGTGRITLNQFVQLTATRHAEIYGLAPDKGTIAPGSDADIAIWDPTREVTITDEAMHDLTGFTPFAGYQVTGWPGTVIRRGEVVVSDGTLHAKAGDSLAVDAIILELE